MRRHVNRYRGRELGTEAMQHFSYSLGGPGTRFPLTWYTRFTSAARMANAQDFLRRTMPPLIDYLMQEEGTPA